MASASSSSSSSSTIATASASAPAPAPAPLPSRRHRRGYLLPLILASIAFLSMFLPQTLNPSHAFNLRLPSLGSVCFFFLPSLWSFFLFILLHCIIVLLTALSGCFNSYANSTKPLDSESFPDKMKNMKKKVIETKKNWKNVHSVHVSIANLSVSPWQVNPTVSSWRVSAENYGSDGPFEAASSFGVGNSEDYHCSGEITVQDYGDAFSSQDAITVSRLGKPWVAPNRFILHENHGALKTSTPLLDTFPSREGKQKSASSRINDEEASGRERKDATEEERPRIQTNGEMDINGKLEMIITKQHDGQIMADKLGQSAPSTPRSNEISVAKKSTRRSTSLDSSPKDKKHHNLAVNHGSSYQDLSGEDFKKVIDDFILRQMENIKV